MLQSVYYEAPMLDRMNAPVPKFTEALGGQFWFIDSTSALSEGLLHPRNVKETLRDAVNAFTRSVDAPVPDVFMELGQQNKLWVSRAACDICSVKYSLINREHHCRSCLRSVCSSCSPRSAFVITSQLTDLADNVVEPRSAPVRICTSCEPSHTKRPI
jgi:hypothetical protein